MTSDNEIPIRVEASEVTMLDFVEPGAPWWFWCVERKCGPVWDTIETVVHTIIRDGSGQLWVSDLSVPKRLTDYLNDGNRVVTDVASPWGALSEDLRARVAVMLQQLREVGRLQDAETIAELAAELGAPCSVTGPDPH